MISSGNNLFASQVALGIARRARYVICVAAHRALPSRIVGVALDQSHGSDKNFFLSGHPFFRDYIVLHG